MYSADKKNKNKSVGAEYMNNLLITIVLLNRDYLSSNHTFGLSQWWFLKQDKSQKNIQSAYHYCLKSVTGQGLVLANNMTCYM